MYPLQIILKNKSMTKNLINNYYYTIVKIFIF